MTGLVERAAGGRHAIVGAPTPVPRAAADPPGVYHASVTHHSDPARSAGGGAARRPEGAATAAVAEALERMAAATTRLPGRRASRVPPRRRLRLADFSLHTRAQRRHPGFPYASAYPDDEYLTEVYDLGTNESWWVPAALVGLTDEYGPLPTSSGLAADPSVHTALLRATQELVERDAYVSTWLHQLGGREVAAPPTELAELAALGGMARVFDVTPDFSPHPVAVVTGTAPLAGRPRNSLGAACRASWAEAVEKAYLEMSQGTVFAGYHLATHPDRYGLAPEAVTGFDEHAVYYTANPRRWSHVPLHRGAVPAAAPAPSTGDSSAELVELTTALRAGGVRLYYREVSTVDLIQLGLRVVRVLSPDLTPLHHDHNWPFLGGRSADATWRYGDAESRRQGPFPSPYPHALG